MPSILQFLEKRKGGGARVGGAVSAATADASELGTYLGIGFLGFIVFFAITFICLKSGCFCCCCYRSTLDRDSWDRERYRDQLRVRCGFKPRRSRFQRMVTWIKNRTVNRIEKQRAVKMMEGIVERHTVAAPGSGPTTVSTFTSGQTEQKMDMSGKDTMSSPLSSGNGPTASLPVEVKIEAPPKAVTMWQ